MSEGDRALDAWLALKLGWEGYTENRDIMWWCKDGKWLIHNPPHYTGRDWSQLAEALREKKYRVDMAWFDHKPGYGALLRGQYKGLGERQIWTAEADTPGLALGRAAEQALGGEE